jgi:hypothetical protein
MQKCLLGRWFRDIDAVIHVNRVRVVKIPRSSELGMWSFLGEQERVWGNEIEEMQNTGGKERQVASFEYNEMKVGTMLLPYSPVIVTSSPGNI